ncbi:MAG TPA: hypothetical protein VKJ47_10570 [Candidatus Binatia bacterium]|nr:hypothetical protein [Candidatus Binatia bacterium]
MDSQNPPPTQVVALPADRAFVVQFQGAVAGQAAPIAGRVEHLTSGRRARFHSWEELQRFIEQELAQLGTDPPDSPGAS